MENPLPILKPVFREWRGFTARIRDIDMFFQGNDPVHRTMRRVAGKLEEAGIPYAIIGGMAVNAHRYVRTTGDVDFLLTAEGYRAFVELFVSRDFQKMPDRPRRFLDPETDATFDVLITGRFPGSGRPGPIAFPNPADSAERLDGRWVIGLAKLIELKLAARRHRDFGDVVELIRIHNLDESYLSQIHPSLAPDFIECLEEKRREDEYEARENDEP